MIDRFEGFISPGTPEEKILDGLDLQRLPVHVAVIMDGNGRWASSRGMERIEGHKQGARSARIIAECAARLGIKHLTLFTFSSENWKRPLTEINQLMEMLHAYLVREKKILRENRIRLNVVGDLEGLPTHLRRQLKKTMEYSRSFDTMQINLALNYGSRMEILKAVRSLIESGVRADEVDEKLFASHLFTAGIPDPDLMIRTSGEYRLSNFLLYQLAYTELYFSDRLWPDFRTGEFLEAISTFQKRDRRFGVV